MVASNAIAPNVFTTSPINLLSKTNILRIQYNEKNKKKIQKSKNVKQALTDEHLHHYCRQSIETENRKLFKNESSSNILVLYSKNHYPFTGMGAKLCFRNSLQPEND